MNQKRTDGESIEIVLGNVLRWGTLISAAVIALGGIAYLSSDGGDTPHYEAFHGEPTALQTVWGIVADARARHAQGIIQFGLLLLVATPIMRVVGALVAFALRRDLQYAIVSSLVLAALLYSLLAS